MLILNRLNIVFCQYFSFPEIQPIKFYVWAYPRLEHQPGIERELKMKQVIMSVLAIASFALACSGGGGLFSDSSSGKRPSLPGSEVNKPEQTSGDATATNATGTSGHGPCAPDANLTEHPECNSGIERAAVTEKGKEAPVTETKVETTAKTDEKKPADPGASPAPTPTPTTAAAPTKKGLLELAPDKRVVGGVSKTVWIYSIPDNKAALPWNDAGTILDMKVGDVLRIKNLDKTSGKAHGFHTGGTNAPCRHGGDRQYDANGVATAFNATGTIAVGGAFFECDMAKAVDTTAANDVYDHTQGTGARIFIKATP